MDFTDTYPNLTEKETLEHPFWQFVARDKDLLIDYVARFFPEMTKRWGYEKAMPVQLASPRRYPYARAIQIAGVNHGSSLASGYHLTGVAHILGIGLEVQKNIRTSLPENP